MRGKKKQTEVQGVEADGKRITYKSRYIDFSREEVKTVHEKAYVPLQTTINPL